MASNCSQPFCKSCSITSVLAELGPSALVIQPDISGYQRWRFKSLFRTSVLTQYWLAYKLTCTKRNFDTHQSVTDITAAIETPWMHKLWLGLVLTTGRSSIIMFVLTSVDWWLCLWPTAKLQPNFGFKMKLACRGHDHALPLAFFRVT